MITLRKFGMNENEIIKYEKDNEQKLSKKVKNLYLKMDLFTNLDEKYIQELEKMIGSNLPKDYRDFLKKNNGGYPDKQCFGNGNIVNFFLGFYPNTKPEVSINYYMQIYQGRYPDGTLPIASAGVGDLILLGIEEKINSNIFYWDSNGEIDYHNNVNNSFENTSPISESFNGFLDILNYCE
jgi:hypothetical protein